MSNHRLRIGSGVAGVLAVTSYILAGTLPRPPADRGLFDIGPVVGLYVMALAARLAILGRRAE